MARSTIQAKRKVSPLACVLKTEALSKYIFSITNNNNVFPKRYRYDLIQQLHNTALDLNTSIIEAASIVPKFKKESKKKIHKIEEALDHARHLGALMTITNGIIQLKNPEEFARLYTEMTKSLTIFYNNTKARHARLVSKKEYYKRYAQNKLNAKITRLNYQVIDQYYRDSDGFYMLIQKR